MKVLLFVDGPKGPKCCGSVSPQRYRGPQNANLLHQRHYEMNGWWLTHRQQRLREKAGARRVWLVECENVEAGRKAICPHDCYGARCRKCGANITVTYGRILAQGGAA